MLDRIAVVEPGVGHSCSAEVGRSPAEAAHSLAEVGHNLAAVDRMAPGSAIVAAVRIQEELRLAHRKIAAARRIDLVL